MVDWSTGRKQGRQIIPSIDTMRFILLETWCTIIINIHQKLRPLGNGYFGHVDIPTSKACYFEDIVTKFHPHALHITKASQFCLFYGIYNNI